MEGRQRVFAVAISALMLASILFLLAPNTEISCGEGTVEDEGKCVLLDRIKREGVVDIYIDFHDDEYNASEGDSVRLIFDDRVYDHYIPERFVIAELGIDIDLSDRSLQILDFDAAEPGVYNYTSTGNCRVLIPGAGEVEVDCQIYCGETENGRSGTITII